MLFEENLQSDKKKKAKDKPYLKISQCSHFGLFLSNNFCVHFSFH